MGMFDFLRRLFGRAPEPTASPAPAPATSHGVLQPEPPAPVQDRPPPTPRPARLSAPRPPVALDEFAYASSLIPTSPSTETVSTKPYRFAIGCSRAGQFLDLSQDSDERWLHYYGLPLLKTPDDLAAWLNIPIGMLAWLTHRTCPRHRPLNECSAHYICRWEPKRSQGWRLLEAPKPQLKQVQHRILHEILDKVPAHPTAHGFVKGRSILTNAEPHLGQRFILKFDLEDFYATVRFSRVVAIFRTLGFSREAGIWLARLTTSSLPWDVKAPSSQIPVTRFSARHLPQGAPTSPALANLSAYGLDVRLSGLAGAYRMNYTRYADDLTFSGPATSIPALREVIPLVERIIRSERFFPQQKKRKLLRNSQRQIVTGVVVNSHPNLSRPEYDRLKAILHNCRKHGPAGQNRDGHADFAAHLRGRIAYVLQLNPERGAKLLETFAQIDWSR